MKKGKKQVYKVVQDCSCCEIRMTRHCLACIETYHYSPLKPKKSIKKMNKKEIEEAIVDIMIKDGPDGHCDGAEVITEFIEALLNDKGEKWIEEYRKK